MGSQRARMAATATGCNANTAKRGRMNTRPIVILGPNGRVGWELRRALTPAPIVPLDRGQAATCPRLSCWSTLQGLQPRAVVNAAAYTAMDKAETDVDAAQLINAGRGQAGPILRAEAGIPWCTTAPTTC